MHVLFMYLGYVSKTRLKPSDQLQFCCSVFGGDLPRGSKGGEGTEGNWTNLNLPQVSSAPGQPLGQPWGWQESTELSAVSSEFLTSPLLEWSVVTRQTLEERA